MSVRAWKTRFANSYASIYRDHSIVAVVMGTTLMLMATLAKVSKLIFMRAINIEPVDSDIFHISNKSTESKSAGHPVHKRTQAN